MTLARSRNFLFALLPLLAENIALSAFDLPVELPSGQTIHLNMEYVGVNPDLYSVYIESTIKDPEEMRLFSDKSDIKEIMSQALKEKWEFHNFEFELREPYEFRSLTLIPTSFVWESTLEKPIFSPLSINGSGSCVLNSSTLVVGSSDRFTGGTTISSGQLSLSNPSFSGNVTISKSNGIISGTMPDGGSETSLPISLKPVDVKDNATSLTGSSALANGIDNSQEKTKEDTTFTLRFSTSGNNFGGGWRLVPYELSFIQKQASFWDKGYPNDGIETMAVLVAPDKSGLYQKRYAYSDFFPARNTLNALTAHPDGTFMLSASLRGVFFFNNAGQLIRSLREDGPYSTYDYSDEKLIRIRHADCLNLSFEYEGKKVININGLPDRIHLEYDDRDLLCKISDEQGSFLEISYDEDGDLDKIIDDSGAILFGSPRSKRTNSEGEEIDAIPLLFNGLGEVFYYQDGKNTLRISYRSWDLEDDEQDEQR